MALGPGWPSRLRPRKPPKPVTSRILWPSVGGVCGGFARWATIQAACHASGSKATSHEGFGPSRPQVTRWRNAPGDDPIDYQGAFQPFQHPQWQRFDPIAGF